MTALTWFLNNNARLLSAVDISGCSGPSTFSQMFEARTNNGSTSPYFP